jgi:hypothetical protein
MAKRQRLKGAAWLGLRLLIAAACVAVVALLVRGFVAARNEAASEAEREQPVTAPLRVATKNGAPVITIDDATQERSGIASQVPAATSYQQQIRAYGMVLDIARLTALSNDYASVKAQVRTAQAKVAMSKPAFERARKLYEDQQALSQAQMQSAEAAFLTDQASLTAAEAQVRSLTATAYQEWGSALGRSLVEETPMTTRLIERQDFLLQITLPPGVSLPVPPATAAMEVAGGARAAITFVSPATHVDPRVQGVSFFYLAPEATGVLPGQNVLAFLPTGKTIEGVTVPASAVVWWQNKTWVYRRAGPETFTRVEIANDLPAPDGGYIVKDLPPDGQIVTRGAQLLLSEEFRAQIRVEDSQ